MVFFGDYTDPSGTKVFGAFWLHWIRNKVIGVNGLDPDFFPTTTKSNCRPKGENTKDAPRDSVNVLLLKPIILELIFVFKMSAVMEFMQFPTVF